MVHIFCAAVLDARVPNASRLLAAEYELSSFGYFQRGSVQEFISFFAKTVVDRSQPGVRQKVEQDAYVGYVFVKDDGVAGVVVTDASYPQRVAFSFLNKLTDEFSARYADPNAWRQLAPASTPQQFPDLKMLVAKYQDPETADPMARVQRELDDTKVILHKTMESMLQRGEKLDDLVAKSDTLSSQSKMFYKTAKKTNSCCYVL